MSRATAFSSQQSPIGRSRQAAWHIALVVLFSLFCFGAVAVRAESVRPIDAVVTNVNVRASPDTDQLNVVGALIPGDEAELLGSVPYFYRVRLSSGVEGYVSKRWTQIVSAPAGPVFRVHVIDVGTGLATFVEGPDFTLLYDAGSRDDKRSGENNRLLAYLRHVRPDLIRIDHFVISHAHEDHISLAPDIFASYEIGAVWDSGVTPGSCVYRRMLEAIHDEPGVQFHRASTNTEGQRLILSKPGCKFAGRDADAIQVPGGTVISDDPVTLGTGSRMRFLYVDDRPHKDLNENTLVARLDLGEVRVLMMGDAEAGEREDPIVPPDPESIEGTLIECCDQDLRANVMIVGHHGSRTSSRRIFLDQVQASDYIISSGPFPYSSVVLPDPVVEEELRGRGELWSTANDDDACGMDDTKIGSDADNRPGGCDSVLVTIDGNGSYTVEYFREAD